MAQYTNVFRSYEIDGMELVQMNDAILAGGLGIGLWKTFLVAEKYHFAKISAVLLIC